MPKKAEIQKVRNFVGTSKGVFSAANNESRDLGPWGELLVDLVDSIEKSIKDYSISPKFEDQELKSILEWWGWSAEALLQRRAAHYLSDEEWDRLAALYKNAPPEVKCRREDAWVDSLAAGGAGDNRRALR